MLRGLYFLSAPPRSDIYMDSNISIALILTQNVLQSTEKIKIPKSHP